MNIRLILELHAKWLKGEEGGRRANFRDADLRGVNLCGAILYGAEMRGVDLRRANLSRANLCVVNFTGANFRHAHMHGANLTGANLWSCVGNRKEIKSTQIETYDITYTKDILQIDEYRFSFEEWKNFTRKQIEDVDHDFLSFWKKWEDFIFKMIEMSPAE